jgi:NADH:ubiquinone oxidoreductase subunit 2 (subunit N)
MIGIPLTAGFWNIISFGKIFVSLGDSTTGIAYGIITGITALSIASLYYPLSVKKAAPSQESNNTPEFTIILSVLALLIIFIGLLPDYLTKIIIFSQ